MAGLQGPDVPSTADARRMRTARRKSRQEVAAAQVCYAASSIEAFRLEIGATVRSASPFLIALLATDDLLLYNVVETIEPGYGWPCRPRLSSLGRTWPESAHTLRHIAAGLRPDVLRDVQFTHGTSVGLSDYTSAKVRIAAHSIEVRVRLKTVTFDTCFGILRIEVGRHLPETLAMACIGQLAADIVDHPSLRAAEWRVAAVEPWNNGSVLIVETGSTAYRLPWAR